MSAPAIPRRVGDFEDVEERARGGMSVVYAAQRVGDRSGARWALKFPLAELSQDPSVSARLRDEGALVRSLPRHPGIVPIEAIELHDGLPYLVMPWIEGVSLRQVIGAVHDGGLAIVPERVDAVIQLAVDALDAIAFAHQHKVVHRDVSPENILLALDGSVHLTDFGIARLFHGVPLKTRIGKLAYMPPEQVEGAAEPRSDVYALGVTLCELLGASIERPGAIEVPAIGVPAFEALVRSLIAPAAADRPDAAAALVTARACRRGGSASNAGRQQLRELVARVAPAGPTAPVLRQRVAAAIRQAGIASAVLAVLLLALTTAAVVADRPQIALGVDPDGGRPIDAGIDGGACVARPECVDACGGPPDAAYQARDADGRAAFEAECVACADRVRAGTVVAGQVCAPPDPATAAALDAAICDRAIEPVACGRLALASGMLNDRDRAPTWVENRRAPVTMLVGACGVASGTKNRRAMLACAALELLGVAPDRAADARQTLCEYGKGDSPAACAARLAAEVCTTEHVAEACALAGDAQRGALETLCGRGDHAACTYRWLRAGGPRPLNAEEICTGPTGTAIGCRAVLRGATGGVELLKRSCALGNCDPAGSLKLDEATLAAECPRHVSACANLVFQRRAAGQNRDWKAPLALAKKHHGARVRDVPEGMPARAQGYAAACYLGSAAGCDKAVAAVEAAKKNAEKAKDEVQVKALDTLRSDLRIYAEHLRTRWLAGAAP